jgi:hypothetical protein
MPVQVSRTRSHQRLVTTTTSVYESHTETVFPTLALLGPPRSLNQSLQAQRKSRNPWNQSCRLKYTYIHTFYFILFILLYLVLDIPRLEGLRRRRRPVQLEAHVDRILRARLARRRPPAQRAWVR